MTEDEEFIYIKNLVKDLGLVIVKYMEEFNENKNLKYLNNVVEVGVINFILDNFYFMDFLANKKQSICDIKTRIDLLCDKLKNTVDIMHDKRMEQLYGDKENK